MSSETPFGTKSAVSDAGHDRVHVARMDCLRGAAILLVFLCHCVEASPMAPPVALSPAEIIGSPHKVFYFLLSRGGILGVDLFFAISGFLIHLSYLRESCDPASPSRCEGMLQWRSYFSKRFWRIYPPYLGALLVAIVLQTGLLTGDLKPFWTALHFGLVQNLHPHAIVYVNLVFWTLCVEAQIYVFYPLLLHIRRRVGLRWCLAGAAALNLGGVAAMAWCYWTVPDWMVWVRWIGLLPTTVFVTWLVGFCLAEEFFYDRPGRAHPRRWIIGTGALTLVSLLWLPLYPILRLVYGWWLFLFVGYYARLKAPLGLAEKFLQMMGRCSYSFYLLHTLVLYRLWSYLWPKVFIEGETARFWVCTFVSILVILPLAGLYYNLVEKKSIAWGRTLRARKR